MTLARHVTPGEYYHILNRGAHRQRIVHDKTDHERLLFCILYFQSLNRYQKIGRIVAGYSLLAGFPIAEQDLTEVIKNRAVELVCFSLMPNHFHLLVKEVRAGGIAAYLQQIEVAYTMYYNAKYKTTGHLFQGRYKAIHVGDDRQLMYLSAYIHRNPRELKGWSGREDEFPWSSLQDYTTANRWGGLLATDIIASQFEASSRSNYADFVRTSTAKTLKEELNDLRLS